MKNIYRLTIPYMDVYTTVYVIKTDDGAVVFDAGSFGSDVKDYIVPFLRELGIAHHMVKYIVVSHNHEDHSGGLEEFVKTFPRVCIVSQNTEVNEKYRDYNVLNPEDDEEILNVLKIVTIKGHTNDCIGVYDTRTGTLISGDCLQMYGLKGSGKWGCGIVFINEHLREFEKLRKMDIRHILMAHDYYPYGYSHSGEDVERVYDTCIGALEEIKDLITKNIDADDEVICEFYNSSQKPKIGTHIVAAVRRELL